MPLKLQSSFLYHMRILITRRTREFFTLRSSLFTYKMNWKIKDIELANISRFRGELMGAAMLFIILFHVALPREDMFYGLRRMGNVGVDMFLFLSGIGLWFSWTKNPSAKHFFIRRYLRIYPTWLIIASSIFLVSMVEVPGTGSTSLARLPSTGASGYTMSSISGTSQPR